MKGSGKKPPSRGHDGVLHVMDSAGNRRRFLRGMITHDLVQRGVSFETAYKIADRIRTKFEDREEVPTMDIRDAINDELVRKYGPDLPPSLAHSPRAGSTISLDYHGHPQPFSRGLLARSLHAAGVDTDRAYELVTEVESSFLAEGLTSTTSDEIARRADEVLARYESDSTAQRYRLLRRIHNLPRPLVVYLCGASGTGKSTLSLELAPLLRIYRINATDTIRQVMRMVFTPSIMPALHISSFETPEAVDLGVMESSGSPNDPDFAERLIASFEEQATRVCVGVRAVVERAITENMSIIVEGVHLVPGLVPFPDLEGAAYQVPLLLATLDEEAHRARFLTRTRAGRHGERYLENFGSIRILHDHLLQKAEEHDVQEIETSSGEPPVMRTLRIVTGMLEDKLPELARPGVQSPAQRVPTLLLVIDGLPDRPVRALGNRTPLTAAATPVLDRLAREGRSGLADPVSPGVMPDTASGTLALFGQSPLALKRGPVEAIGAGFDLRADDIALRGNFATFDDAGRVIDRRAGRIREQARELAQAINRLPLPKDLAREIQVRVRVGTEHRLAVVLRGESLSPDIQGSDPGDARLPAQPQTPRALDPGNASAVRTARALALFERAARNQLGDHPINKKRIKKGLPPANGIITRGAGRVHRLVSLEDSGLPLRLACISGDRTVRGLASWLGASVIATDDMTANLDTNLEAKFEAARKALKRHDLVVVHVKGADIAAHDGRPELKAEFVEKVDEQLGRLLKRLSGEIRVVVAADHATLSETGQHAADPVPVLTWGPDVEPDGVTVFDERAAGEGGLERFPLQLLLSRLFNLS
jgi:2,3-bisphosphoglycerate-independent phosphoglycerate mutase